MAVVTSAIIAAASAYSIYNAKKQRDEAKKEAKKRESEIRKANEQAVAEAKSLQQKSEDQARARIARASAEQERSKSVFSTLGAGGGQTLIKKLLGQ